MYMHFVVTVLYMYVRVYFSILLWGAQMLTTLILGGSSKENMIIITECAYHADRQGGL